MSGMKIRKGDTVIIIAGSDKGKKGEVIQTSPKKNVVYVKGVNLLKRSVKKSQEMPSGGFVEVEAPIHVSNVMLFCPKNNKGVRVGYETGKDKKKIRVAKGVDYKFD